jgi:uncharacterized integral membrane protein
MEDTMADDRQTDAGTDDRGSRRRVDLRLVLAVGLAAVFLSLIVQNTQDVTVSWLFWDITAPLWIVLLATAAIALVLGEVISAAVRRRKKSQSRKS